MTASSRDVALSRLATDLGTNAELDRVVAPVEAALARLLPDGPAKDALHGRWLGHPLHPMLTDLPIGFWTSALVLDLVGFRKGRKAADLMVGLGVLSTLPTFAAGAADWTELDARGKRTGIVHAASNLTATVLYAMSWRKRRDGRRAAGVVLGIAGAAAASVGGYLGGHLAFGADSDLADEPRTTGVAAVDQSFDAAPTTAPRTLDSDTLGSGA